VIVSDGFVGNIALKICEGLAFQIFGLLKKSINSSLVSQVGGMLSKGAFKALSKTIDYTEYGGAPLLGVRGVCVIGAWPFECQRHKKRHSRNLRQTW